MAFTLSTIYKAQDKFSGPLAAMERANKKFASAQDKSLGALKSSFATARNAIIGLAGNIGIATLMMTGVGAIKDFDASLASLRTITGLSGKAFIPFKNEIIAIGNATKMAFPEVAKAMELIGSAQPELLDNAKAMGQMTRASILLSRASGMDLASSTAALTKSMNQFGAGAEYASKFVDILSTSEQKGTATTQQIVDALTNGGSTAKTLGLTFDETNAIIQAYAKAGVLGSEAGTQMASVLAKLAAQSNKNFNPSIVGATKAIDNLAKANLSYTDLIKIGGQEGAKFMATLINQNAVVQKLSGNLYDVGNAQKQADERSSSFTFKLEALSTRFKNLMISGNETSGMLNFFGKIVGFVTDNLGAILAVIGTSIAVYGAYYAIMTTIRLGMIAYNVVMGIHLGLQGYPIAMKANVIALAAFNVTQKAAAAATWLFNSALFASPITWIIVGITALVGILYLLIKNWDGVKTAMTGFFTAAWDGIKKFARLVLDFMLAPVMLVLKAISKISGAQWAKDAVTGIEAMKNQLISTEGEGEAVKPVNTIKAANDAQTQRYEEINKQQLSIMLQNKSNQQVNIVGNTAAIPVTTNTY